MADLTWIDLIVDIENENEGAYEILRSLRPQWEKENIHIKVGILQNSKMIVLTHFTLINSCVKIYVAPRGVTCCTLFELLSLI